MVGNFSKTIYRFYLFNQKGDGGGVRVKGTRDCVLLHFINYPFINYPFINYPFLGMLNLAEYFFDFAKTFLSNF